MIDQTLAGNTCLEAHRPCPPWWLAAMMPRVYLGPALPEAATLLGLEAAGAWVDEAPVQQRAQEVLTSSAAACDSATPGLGSIWRHGRQCSHEGENQSGAVHQTDLEAAETKGSEYFCHAERLLCVCFLVSSVFVGWPLVQHIAMLRYPVAQT